MDSLRALEQQVLDDLPAAFDDEHMSSEVLGPRISLCLAHPSAFERLHAALQHRLLVKTTAIAKAKSRVFAEVLADVSVDDVEEHGVTALPTTERAVYEAPQAELCLDDRTFELCTFTSGSTTGRSLIIYRSTEEQQYLADLILEIEAAGAPDETPTTDADAPLLSLGLIRTNPHGTVMFVSPETGQTVLAPYETDQDHLQAERLLATPYYTHGADAAAGRPRWIRRLAAPTFDVARFTGLLVHHGQTELADKVQSVEFTGRLLTRREDRMLRRVWHNAQVVNVFSMSELFSGCRYCELCEAFHFDPYVLYEVLDVDSLEPLKSGRGLLAVTGLYPFNQMTPFVRYLNGDVVDVWRSDCPLGPRTFRPLGRFKRSVRVPGLADEGAAAGDALLCPGDVVDALDELPDVRRSSVPGMSAPERAEWGWLPLFELHADEEGAHLELELRYDPAMFPERTAEVVRALRVAIVAARPRFGAALDHGALRIVPRGPGALTGTAGTDAARRRQGLLNDPLGIGGLPLD
ncbi:MAG: hypothetical protein AAGC60_23235 [Acidobacteriota bacterium]